MDKQGGNAFNILSINNDILRLFSVFSILYFAEKSVKHRLILPDDGKLSGKNVLPLQAKQDVYQNR